jgi:hypothetical protein
MRRLLCALLFLAAAEWVRGQADFGEIGVTALRAQDASLTGSGVIISQIESAGNPLQFEVNPGSPGQPAALFTWRSSAGLAVRFPNIVGLESAHADTVAEDLYGEFTGVAPGLSHVANYETDLFYSDIILRRVQTRGAIFNQSFEFGPHDAAQDLAYDNYIDLYRTIVVSGVGDGGAVLSPADCYNGIGVAAYGGASSVGPTADGRCKPDITAPATFTSFSTPEVAGAAAVLVQAARREGVNATAAIDSRTIKCLLLNGATKPGAWSHTATAPLDPTYGAGILNVFNSWTELSAGRHAPTVINSGTDAVLNSSTNVLPQGWDFRALTSGANAPAVAHYRINTTDSGNAFITLVWNKPFNAARINNLSLRLYDSGGNQIAASESIVDNVQHLYIPGLAAGTYDLQIIKAAGRRGAAGVVTLTDVYAVTWDFLR